VSWRNTTWGQTIRARHAAGWRTPTDDPFQSRTIRSTGLPARPVLPKKYGRYARRAYLELDNGLVVRCIGRHGVIIVAVHIYPDQRRRGQGLVFILARQCHEWILRSDAGTGTKTRVRPQFHSILYNPRISSADQQTADPRLAAPSPQQVEIDWVTGDVPDKMT